MNNVLQIGKILSIKEDLSEYRIISIVADTITLCRMNTTKFELIQLNKTEFFNLLDDEAVELKEDKPHCVVDIDALPDAAKDSYIRKKKVINEVLACYGPTYMGLSGKKKKHILEEILKRYDITKYTFWRMCTKYFQSGLSDTSLIDERCFGTNTGKKYSYAIKTGRRSEYFSETGVIVDEQILGFFDEALKDYRSGRHKSLRSAYDKMNNIHFTRTEIVNGVQTLVLMPVNERPTLKQFYYYAEKNISKDEKDIIKTSQMEYRNNKRLLNSDSLYGVLGPGDMVEIDACEADVSLVSSVDRNKAIGRPIVYFMIDVYSRMILAVSIAFDNNSLLGITNLFLNLADDKKEYCKRNGMEFSDDRLWPSNILPNRIRVDRGSEFKSKEFTRICLALSIEKDNVSGGSGSLKGVIEQSFHQMHNMQNVHLEDKGLIEKRHDSRHHEEATLTIEDYTKMIINFVLTHNQKYLETYPFTKDMIDKKIMKVPAILWEYGIENCMTPRPIQSKEQYYYNLMTPIHAKVSRKGIEYKGLFYISDDKYLVRCRINAGNKKVPFDARMDLRSVGAVYYISEGKLIKASLNEDLTGNSDYKYMTMKQWEEYRKKAKELDAKGDLYNQEISAYNYMVNENIVNTAVQNASTAVTDKKDMRREREIEKQAVSSDNRIEKRLDIPETHVVEEEPIAAESKHISRLGMSSEERRALRKKALEDYKNECW